MTQPEALRLAEKLEQGYVAHTTVLYPAAAELRRLHAVNQELLAALVNLRDFAVMSNKRQVEYLDAGNKHPAEVAQAAIAKGETK
tara:strand:- start:253 stop:507 length:255 start_codon:yes stop_codon:yes gene_type:complete